MFNVENSTLNLNNDTFLKILRNNSFDSSEIKPLVYNASDILAPYWTLKTFIAINPLQGLENLNFFRAIDVTSSYFDLLPLPSRNDCFQFIKQNEINNNELFKTIESTLSHFDYDFKFSNSRYNFLDLLFTAFKVNPEEVSRFALNQPDKSFFSFLSYENEHLKNISLSNQAIDFSINKKIKFNLVKWLQKYLDEGQASFISPNNDLRFFSFWKRLAIYDYDLPLNKEMKGWIRGLPDKPSDVVMLCLKVLGVPESDWEEYFRCCLADLPGWCSYIKWKSINEESTNLGIRTSLLDYVAVYLSLEIIFLFNYCEKKKMKFDNLYLSLKKDSNLGSRNEVTLITIKRFFHAMQKLTNYNDKTISEILHEKVLLKRLLTDFIAFEKYEGKICLLAIENTFRNKVGNLIKNNLQEDKTINNKYDAQFVFCIDVRSEQIRRCIESIGNYETFGFAGFFGLPIKIYNKKNNSTHDSCPVLLKPKHAICEEYEFNNIEECNAKVENVIYRIKNNISSFLCVELLGLCLSINLFLKTFFPFLVKKIKEAMISINKSYIFAYDLSKHKIFFGNKEISISGISKEEQVFYSYNVLKMIGLTKNFSPFVIFCGHSASTENNPYAAALDCGACGAGSGGPNAKVLAQILNTQEVRTELSKKGILIPELTVFLAAEHTTTTDEIKLYKTSELDSDLIGKLDKDLKIVKKLSNKNRLKSFDNLSPFEKILCERTINIKSSDWSEVRPEWGLAGNAMFLIAPRSISKNIDLNGRSFLHSYEWKEDVDLSVLETIMTAPMIVAQWINSQYYFSSVLNQLFGSGSKIIHNLTGKFGVMEGNLSDLKIGLPIQSIKRNSTDFVHIPIRLNVYIYAQKNSVEHVIQKHDVLKKLIYNNWIKIIVLDPLEKKSYISLGKNFVDLNLERGTYE